MADYIKRSEAISEAIEAAKVWDGWYVTRRAEMITAYLNEKIPAADVIKVVRCGDCVHQATDRCCFFSHGPDYMSGPGEDFYCADGEEVEG